MRPLARFPVMQMSKNATANLTEFRYTRTAPITRPPLAHSRPAPPRPAPPRPGRTTPKLIPSSSYPRSELHRPQQLHRLNLHCHRHGCAHREGLTSPLPLPGAAEPGGARGDAGAGAGHVGGRRGRGERWG